MSRADAEPSPIRLGPARLLRRRPGQARRRIHNVLGLYAGLDGTSGVNPLGDVAVRTSWIRPFHEKRLTTETHGEPPVDLFPVCLRG